MYRQRWLDIGAKGTNIQSRKMSRHFPLEVETNLKFIKNDLACKYSTQKLKTEKSLETCISTINLVNLITSLLSHMVKFLVKKDHKINYSKIIKHYILCMNDHLLTNKNFNIEHIIKILLKDTTKIVSNRKYSIMRKIPIKIWSKTEKDKGNIT